ncbi:MAG: flagellar basal body-associated FliL family protein [Gammaproteobacteria bacterium]|nr:flagellar basal body-associated FliL family protein [Gammaproteobacteria bacterium]
MADVEQGGDDLEQGDAKKKGGKGKLIVFIVAAVLLLGGGAGAGLYFTGALTPDAQTASEDDEDFEDEDEDEEEEAKGEAIYVDLHPAFTVNLQGKSKARFLQASVQVLTREPEVEQQIKQHAPMIRNKLVMLFSAKTSQELRTLEGKESLQNEARSAIENVLKAERGEGGVEAVFFTSFVMQ